jgi:hypothetical protein
MPPLTLVQKRALLAAANNVHKKELAYNAARVKYEAIMPHHTPEGRRKYLDVVFNARKAYEVLERLAQKLGVNGREINYHLLSKNAIANVIKKRGGVTLIRDKLWRRGLEAEKARARANYNNFTKKRTSPTTNHIAASHRKKTPSPPRQRTPRRTPSPPANNAHRRVHGIGPVNNTRITWARRANGKINRFRTLTNLSLILSNAERNALRNMSENNAKNYIRNLARGH